MNLLSLSLYRTATYLGYPFIAAYLAYRKAKGKEDLDRFPERMGYSKHPRPDGRLLWFHGASVGETLSILPLIQRVQHDYPDLNIMVTSGTVTSAKLLSQRLTGNAFHQYIPVDCTAEVKRFVDYWKPDVAFWIESEFWPNILSEIAKRKIPLILLNGRVSDRSFKRWSKRKYLSSQLQGMFTKSFAQTREDARRLKEIGAKNTDCVGNIKFAAAPLSCDENELKALQKQIGGRPCWVAASTHAGEETMIAEIHSQLKEKLPDILTVSVPRHPNRADELEKNYTKAGLKVARRSRKDEITKETDVYLGDTMGEMGLSYRLGEIAFVGGSLIPFGGQNMIEPGRLHKAVICGPYTMNFREIVENAQKMDALTVVKDQKELCDTVYGLLTDKKALVAKQENAFAFANAESGVLDRLMVALTPFLTFEKNKS